MKSKVSTAFIECNKFPHTNLFWPHRMREKGTFVQIIAKGHSHNLLKKIAEN